MTTEPPLRILNRREVADCAPSMSRILEITRSVYQADAAGQVQAPTKIGVTPAHPGSFLHAMPARVDGTETQGFKWVSYYPDNPKAPDSHALIVLNDPVTGAPTALLEGMWVTYARTAACAVVLAERLGLPDGFTVGLVGAGALARWSLATIAAAFPGTHRVVIASRTPASANALADEANAQEIWDAGVVETPTQVLADAHLVISSTTGRGTRAIELAEPSACRILAPLEGPTVCTPQTLQAMDQFVSDDLNRVTSQLPADLRDLVTDRHVGLAELYRSPRDTDENGRSAVFVTGKASFDLAIAAEIVETAVRRGLGVEVRLDDSTPRAD